MSETPKPERIEEEPKTEAETEKEIDEEKEKLVEVRERQTQALTDRMTELTKSVDKLSSQLQKATFVSPAMDEARKVPVRDPNEKAKTNKPDATKTKAEKKVQEVLDANEEKSPGPKPAPDEKKPADAKEWSASKFTYLLTAAAFFGPTLLQVFEGLFKAAGNKDLSGLGLPDELTAKLMAFVAEKKAEDATAYWKDIGDYITKSPEATSPDLIMLLQFIVKTNPLPAPFFWPSFEEAGTMAATLAPQYVADRAKFFAGLAALKTSEGKILPRATAGAVAQNAIALSMLPPGA